MIDYAPAIVALYVLALLIVDVVQEVRRGVWHGYQVGMIAVVVMALVWWWSVKTTGRI